MTTNYGNCTKSRLGFVWKIMGILYTLNWFVEKKDGCWTKSRFDFVMKNYGKCTKSRLGFVRKIMGIRYISELILWRKKMGVEQKVD